MDNKYIITEVILKRFEMLDTYITFDRLGLGFPHVGEYAFASLPDNVSISEKEVYTKRDIMILFDVEEKKALLILKFLKQCEYGFQLGKSYYVTRDNMKKFMDEQAGNTIYLQ